LATTVPSREIAPVAVKAPLKVLPLPAPTVIDAADIVLLATITPLMVIAFTPLTDPLNVVVPAADEVVRLFPPPMIVLEK
jgi:hypothetical protein